MTTRTALNISLKPMVVALLLVTPGGMASRASAAQAAQNTSTVAGCITDPTGQPLPDVTVDVVRGGSHRTVFTNAAGCYAAADVPSGSCFVFARLTGFVSVTHDQLNIVPGQSETVNLQMRVAPMCECISYEKTLAHFWNEADAIVRIRITGHDSTTQDVKHVAEILKVWKQDPRLGATNALTFLQSSERNEVEPYAVGQEFVIFLRWTAAKGEFVRWSDGDGTVSAFAIEDGRIHSGPVSYYVGMDEQQLVQNLALLATR
jgi:hypothetical protein